MAERRTTESVPSLGRGTSHRMLLFWRLSPMQAIVASFLAVILIGAVLFTLLEPRLSLLHGLFLATSAVCLVGSPSSAEYMRPAGQALLLLLVQAGAIGYMSAVILIARLLGIRLGMTGAPVQESGVVGARDAWRILRSVTVVTLLIEGVGALLLALRFLLEHHLGTIGSLVNGVIYSITGFCNAGFWPLYYPRLGPPMMFSRPFDSPDYARDLWLLGIIGVLMVLGGLGVGVLRELPHLRRMSLHAKLAVASTLALLVLGAALFYLFEMRNTLVHLPNLWHRLGVSAFMSASARSAGFDPIYSGFLSPPTLLILGLLSIVGGAPGGTAGGVKVTTLAVIVLAIAALARHRGDIEVFRRRISGARVRLALSLVTFYLLFLLLFILAVSFTEFVLAGRTGPDAQAEFNRVLFTVVAAFGNVGWGSPVGLHPASQALLIAGMLVGRLGTLVLVAFFARSTRPQLRRLPEEAVMTG